MRAFMRIVDALPDARVALVLGNGEAWVHRPDRHARRPIQKDEWEQGTTLGRGERVAKWIVQAGRGDFVRASDALDAFAPHARVASKILLAELGGEIDVLVGSEAISVGHNLQDSTCLVQLDLPWNPMVIEQRIGRVDRRGGGRTDDKKPYGRKIVDIHYCWSDAAIEREVQLRARLRSRATGAIEDTNFDELLLHELLDRIQKVREARAREAAAASVLGGRQHRLAEERGRTPEFSASAGSELDGLRILATWKDDRRDASTLASPLACGALENDVPPHFLVTLGLEPVDGRGAPLPLAGGMLVSLPIDDEADEADLEALVRSLMVPSLPLVRPGPSLRSWTDAIVNLDRRLQALRAVWLERHNREVGMLTEAKLSPHAKGDPGQRLRNLAVAARDALRDAAGRVPRDSPTGAMLLAKKERVVFLGQEVLDPQKLGDVVAEVGEKATQDLLLHLRDHADKVLRDEFDTFFEKLAGGLWQARQAAGTTDAQVGLPAVDALWGALRVRVLAATVRGPSR